MGDTTLSPEEALLWLNDRLGHRTKSAVAIGVHGEIEVALIAEGILTHRGNRMLTDQGDRSGFYEIGDDAYVDVTRLGSAEVAEHDDSTELYFRPAENVLVSVNVDDAAGGE